MDHLLDGASFKFVILLENRILTQVLIIVIFMKFLDCYLMDF